MSILAYILMRLLCFYDLVKINMKSMDIYSTSPNEPYIPTMRYYRVEVIMIALRYTNSSSTKLSDLKRVIARCERSIAELNKHYGPLAMFILSKYENLLDQLQQEYTGLNFFMKVEKPSNDIREP